MEQWQVDRSGGTCARTGRALEEGEAYFAVLFEEGEGFRREDVSVDAWDGPPEGAFCHFKSKMPVKQKKQRLLVDDDILINFFERLATETDSARLRFRFVLALILMRKRLLKYEETLCEGESEFWLMRLVKREGKHRVLNPRLTDDEIQEVSQELSSILRGDIDECDGDVAAGLEAAAEDESP